MMSETDKKRKSSEVSLALALKRLGLVKSANEARQLIKQGAVRLYYPQDWEEDLEYYDQRGDYYGFKVTNPNARAERWITEGMVINVGKHKWIML